MYVVAYKTTNLSEPVAIILADFSSAGFTLQHFPLFFPISVHCIQAFNLPRLFTTALPYMVFCFVLSPPTCGLVLVPVSSIQ